MWRIGANQGEAFIFGSSFHEPLVDKDFFMKLLQRQVLINPGYIYDPQDHQHIRLSYAYATYEELQEGLQILHECVVEAIGRKSK